MVGVWVGDVVGKGGNRPAVGCPVGMLVSPEEGEAEREGKLTKVGDGESNRVGLGVGEGVKGIPGPEGGDDGDAVGAMDTLEFVVVVLAGGDDGKMLGAFV